jgi:DNA repair photolyase
MATKALVVVAPTSKIITKSTFKNYDACINPYVGCEFGCSYCYVRFFVKHPQRPWGEFIKIREHLAEQLPKELAKGYLKLPDGREPILAEDGSPTEETKPKHRILPIQDARLVFGTMTDPYQPQEKKWRITRTALDALLAHGTQFKKVGIFTRSPLVLQDLSRIVQLPRARVHFTVTPFPPEVMRAIEPYSPVTSRRWDVVKKLKAAGLRVHVNVSPVMPGMSEDLIAEFAKQLAILGVDEYFVDPMQPYKESFQAFRDACTTVPSLDWNKIERTMLNRNEYLDWKFDYYQRWNAERKKHEHLAPHQLPIWSDHENKVWVDMRSGQQMDPRNYNDG